MCECPYKKDILFPEIMTYEERMKMCQECIKKAFKEEDKEKARVKND